jgi:hypothetical protein
MLFITSIVFLYFVTAVWACTPFATGFPAGSVSSESSAPFIGITPADSFSITEDGLSMFLKRPDGEIITTGGVNSQVGQGTTINSTFTLL